MVCCAASSDKFDVPSTQYQVYMELCLVYQENRSHTASALMLLI
jgi:hypothetical protein